MKVKLIITDIDGVWTDGGMYYSDEGIESKKFNTSDSVGILLAKEAKIDVVVMTGEDVKSVQNRMTKLKIEDYYSGVKNKLELAQKIASERGISLDEIAFVGDEINDLKLLKAVGFSGCPSSAPYYTREIVHFVTQSKGGEGAFRDFVIEVLRKENLFFETFQKIIG